jgi:hypothetical protein
MLGLFLDHPPLFVACEIALILSLALFFGALFVTIDARACEVFQLREMAKRAARVRMFRARRERRVQAAGARTQ